MRRCLILATLALTTFTCGLIARGQDDKEKENQLEGYIRLHYTKQEHMIPMRDGVKLFTAVYVPRDTTKKYPLLMKRTPYSVAPYGVDKYPASLGPSEHFVKAGYIFVNQDVRGRFMSEGRVRAGHAARAEQAEAQPTSTRAATPTTRSSGC